MKKDELIIITKSKNLINYVFTVSNNAPKKFRYSLISKMQSVSLDILENVIYANEELVAAQGDKRLSYQHNAIAKLKVLDALALAAREQQCILPKQYEVLSSLINDCLNLIGAWINSDKKRKNQAAVNDNRQ